MIKITEMNTVVAQYKLDEITDNTEEITLNCIRAAEANVLSYLSNRYDIEAIQKMSSKNPYLSYLKEMIKDIALYLLLRRHNIDIAYERVVDTYKMHIDYLSQVAKGTISIPGLPTATDPDGRPKRRLEMGSKPKRDFDF